MKIKPMNNILNKNKKINNQGFVATGVLYSLISILAIILFIIVTNLKTMRNITYETAKEVKSKLATYEVIYNANGAEGTMANSIFESGKTSRLKENTFSKVGHNFNGWGLTQSQSSNLYANRAQINNQGSTESGVKYLPVNTRKSINLYAIWEPNKYNVTFNPNGGNVTPTSKEITYASTYGNLPNPTYTGYDFNGWFTATIGGSKIEETTTVTMTSSQTLYAQWSPKKYTVTFNPNGGSVSPTSKEITYSSTYGNLPVPAKTGYTFQGWFTETTGGIQITPSTQVTIAQAHTLYAHWKEIKAYAIYSVDDKSLTFVKSANVIKEGDTYNGKNVTAAYTDFETKDYYDPTSSNIYVPWHSHAKDIISVDIKDKITPISTAGWFKNFKNISSLDLTNIDTSNVTNMNSMFYGTGENATSFKFIGLSQLDVSSVTNMSCMFCFTASNETTWDIGDIGSWDVSNVTDMSSMFYGAGGNATSFKLSGLSQWDVSNVTNMANMFYASGRYATTWDIGDISSWDVSSVTNMSAMFYSTGNNATTWYIGDIGNWNVSNVTNMYWMFCGAANNATTWDIGNISKWNVSNVTNMNSMFYKIASNVTDFKLDLSGWNTSKVTDMSSMFYETAENATNIEINLSNWNTAKVTNMSQTFSRIGYKKATNFKIIGLSKWNVSSVSNMKSMFNYTAPNATSWDIEDISKWNVSNVTDMSGMFYMAGRNLAYTLNLSGWNVSKVTSYYSFNYGVEKKIIAPTWKN